jgi:YbbR domain-containing protein
MMELDYKNEEVNAVILLNVDKGVLSKGVYTVDVYLEGSRAATQDVELKSAVLGIF